MKKVIQFLILAPFAIVSFITVSLIDVITLIFVGLNWLVRKVMTFILTFFNGDDDTDDVKEMTNSLVNSAYMNIVDTLYPDDL